MREELGNDKACELVRGAVLEYATTLGETIALQFQGSSLEKLKTVAPGLLPQRHWTLNPSKTPNDIFS